MIDLRISRRLALAVTFSGGVHAAFIALGGFGLPHEPEVLPPLAVRIVDTTPAMQPVPRASAESSVPVARAVQRAQAAPMWTARASSPIAFPPEFDMDQPESAEETAVAEAPPVVSSAEVVALEPSAVEPQPALRNLPPKGRITYSLVYGRDQFPVGKTVQTWETDGTRYLLASRSETTGLLDIVRSQHRTFLSRGSVTSEGLRPDIFLMSRNRGRGTEEARASFDWHGASVTLQAAAGQRQESLPARTQDLLSFIYQLSVHPPTQGRFQQALTNGARLETYEVEVLAEEVIETPMGALRALPVKQIRKAGIESLELWLAIEYRYLPVRIRFFSREGEPQGEQIVTEIRLAEEEIAKRDP